MVAERFEQMLTGGHPNSLGRTIEVVDAVLADRVGLDELYACYSSRDEVVRLRTSSAMKRVCAEQPDWLVPYLPKLIDDVGALAQPSAQWTLAQLFATLHDRMTAEQTTRATALMMRNLETSTDWIVLNTTMQTLAEWARSDDELARWLCPRLDRLAGDSRRSVANRARRLQISCEK